MTTIDSNELDTVCGGFGALLGALIQQAPAILQGVQGIVGAAKGGQAAPAQAGPPGGAAAMAAPGMGGGDEGGGRRPRVSVTVMNG